MYNKTVSKIFVIAIMATMITALLPTLPVGAVTLASITPTSGNVGTTVRMVGEIDTLGGSYTIGFDIDNAGGIDWAGGEGIATANAPDDSYLVNRTFNVPACLGSDAGLAHMVALRDDATLNVKSTYFNVITRRSLTVSPSRIQQGDNVTLTMSVSGGTVANQLNEYDIYATDPAGGETRLLNLQFNTSAVGSGSATAIFPVNFSGWGGGGHVLVSPTTNLTGTYELQADRDLPGDITNASFATFEVGITDAPSYARLDTVNVRTTGWTPGQNVTVTITNPSGAVAKTWPNMQLAAGNASLDWIIPVNAPLGDYNVTVYNVTGNDKAAKDTQLFTVNPCLLSATVYQHVVSSQRTQTLTMKFAIRYPDGTVYNNITHFDSVSVNVQYTAPGAWYATNVATISLTRANYGADGNWTASWKIPRDATLGSGWKFNIGGWWTWGTMSFSAISDVYGNLGAQGSFWGVSSPAFGSISVSAAVLSVQVTKQPMNVSRQEAATAGLRIRYPDMTSYAAADLNMINTTIRVYANATNVANVTLDASDYNATLDEWTLSWTPDYNIAAGTGYNFTILANELFDVPLNKGPTSTVTTNNFKVSKAVLVVPAVETDDSSYQPGEYLYISFTATYPDGSPVTLGSSTVTLTAPDGFTTVTVHPVHTADGVWRVTVWLSDAQAQTGAWTVTLNANGVNDGYNTGPAVTRTASFTVLPADYDLEDIILAIEALGDRLDAVEADTSALGDSVTAINEAIDALEAAVADLESELGNTASASSVTALANTVNTINSAINALESAVAGKASAADVAAVKTDVENLRAHLDSLYATAASAEDLAALSAAVDALEATVDGLATSAELDDTASDLSADIASSNTLIIVAIVLALVAAVAAIAAVYIILKKIAG